jgi:hypothetical protein
MCALVQAIRKLGIVAGGPGLGDPKNPMYIVRESPADISLSTSSSSRPGTSSSHKDFIDESREKRLVAEDPSTQVDDDLPTKEGYTYYPEERLGRQSAGTTEVRGREESQERGVQQSDIDRGRSFGRRRKKVQIDLEKGPSQ